ncbi:hypothetical protein BH09PAT2_BH09PAT2_10490 [soil metagenome]
MNIIPTLLTTTIEEFIIQMDLFQKYYSRIQLDVTDGELVPNMTTQIDEMVELIANKKVEVLPDVSFDFHLMVKDYELALEKIVRLQKLGMKVNLSLINAGLHPDIPTLNPQYQFSIGLDISPNVLIDSIALHYDLSYIPSIQIMTVEPGFQGSPFLEEMLKKIEQLRTQGYSGEIMIDGGVNEKTIPIISSKTYTPDYLCIGSYLTKAGDIFEKRVSELKELSKKK